MNGSMDTKMAMNNVPTGNVAEVATITLFIRLCSDGNLGKRDYNPDKQQLQGEMATTSTLSPGQGACGRQVTLQQPRNGLYFA